ncbi:beta-N-acetylhexosaminidase [Aliikangiella sp. IMCC44632]
MQAAGPIMLDIADTQLSAEDKKLIQLPLCGGLILFSRNFESAEQIFELTKQIKKLNPSIVIAVDQEGGRVQRFTKGFSKLPELGKLGQLYQTEPEQALEFAQNLGELMALEVQSVGCDISFAPVLDIGDMASQIIGDRAFALEPNDIIALASRYIQGMQLGGMQATGKHFPGHGSVVADSHVAIPVDPRSFTQIEGLDLKPFAALAPQLGAIMPAHIIYSELDSKPAGFSEYWLQKVLRTDLNFDGVIFSDDLSMQGATVAGDFSQRAHAALTAGCDMVLVCNDRNATWQVIDALKDYQQSSQSGQRISRLTMQQQPCGLQVLKSSQRWQFLADSLQQFNRITQKSLKQEV